tara:strand:+ start:43699 stop:44829 length:1131 start_codon:yes stop_codon:yes gene_type:complete
MSLRLHNIEFHLPSESNMKKTKQILSKVTSELKELKRKLSKLERRRPASKYEKEVQKLYVDIAEKRQLVGKHQIVPDYFYANNKKYIKKNFVGAGGYGSVHVYQSNKDSNDKLIIKNFTKYDSTNNEEKLVHILVREKNYDCGVTPIKSHVHTLSNGKKKIFSIMPLMVPIRRIELTPNQKIQCFLSVIRQIQCLMRYGMYYYDLKPENVLSSTKNISKNTKTKKGKEYVLKQCSTKELFRNQFFLGDLGSIWSRRYNRGNPISTYQYLGNNLKKTKHQLHVLNVKIHCIIFLLDLFKLDNEAQDLEFSKTRDEQSENLIIAIDSLEPKLGGVMGYDTKNVPRRMTPQGKKKFIRNLKNWVKLPVAITDTNPDLFI